MLIDRTYFVGELNIPNTEKAAVASQVDYFIEKYEREFLQKALGYSLYKSFTDGLLQDPVLPKWTQLLEGVEYTSYNGKVNSWNGLVSQPLSVINAIDAANNTILIVGRGQQYDPADGVNSTIIPASLVGKAFTFHQRLIGELRPDEYSISGNVLTLTSGVFNSGDTFFFKSASLALSQSSGINKKSPIANYVYYWFMRNNATQTAAMGEVKGTAENAINASPGYKMELAWNEMTSCVAQMRDYLRSNRDTYNWNESFCYPYRDVFTPINTMNI